MTPCPWPVTYLEDCLLPSGWIPTDGDGEPPVAQRLFEDMASDFLWAWTGRRFGICEVALRPCRQRCPDSGGSTFYGRGPYPSGNPWGPVLIGGAWYNITCGTCIDSCSCDGFSTALRLPGPVQSITEVRIDGTVLPEEAYRLDGDRLYRLDGSGWPTCQEMSLPPTEDGTWQIIYERGQEVPHGGQIAAGVLAIELYKAACQDDSCALPQRLQSITRQGVTVAVLDAFDDIDKGHTGIWLIDSWVASVTRPARPSAVYSPDTGRRR